MSLIAISALAVAFALSGCGGQKTKSGGMSGGGPTGGASAKQRASAPAARAEEPDVSWYNAELTVFRLSRPGQLLGLSKLVSDGNRFQGKTVVLASDIDLSGYSGGAEFNGGKGWIPIGGKLHVFKGTFDGDGKVVRGLYINDPKLLFAGLFGRLDSGEVRNLGVVDVRITANGRIGAVAGNIANSRLTACYSTGEIAGKSFVGGLAGHVDRKSSVAACYSAAKVTGDNYVGGLVGDADGGSTVSRSYATGSVSGNEAVGGLLGGLLGKGSSVSNSYSTGTVACGSNGGGIVGIVADGASVTTCYATGAVSGRTRVGGIAGQLNGAITGCVALNPSVKAEGKGFSGRINGYGDSKASSANLALSTIRNSAGTTDWPNRGEKGKDGTDITAAQVSNDGSVGGRFTEAHGWTTMRGMLPGFGMAIRVPDQMRQ